jgi:hypothetical protein
VRVELQQRAVWFLFSTYYNELTLWLTYELLLICSS